MSTPPNQARVAGSPRDRGISAGAASGTNQILGKECQHTEFFTQETQDKQEPQDLQAAQERQEIKEIHVLHDRKALTEKDSVDEDAEIEIEQAIACSRLPSVDSFMSHGFLLARRIRGIELRYQFRCGPMLLRRIFDRWEEQNRQYLTDGPDYYSDFLAMMSKVRFPQGYLRHVLKIARAKNTPIRAQSLPPLVQLLAKLCRELQKLAGGGSFFLASRAVAELFDCTHTTAANWLRALALIDVIEVVSVGDLAEHRASEYRYIACD